MTEIIGVKFKSGGKQYYFDPCGLTVKNGQGVIVETSKGLEYGICTRPNGFVEDTTVIQPLRPLIRIATEEDERIVEANAEKEKQALAICREKVEKFELDMKLVGVEYAFDGSKVLFFFTSEGRVDFRALVKELAAALHTRIELRQIGVRDEARMLGGLGICGKPFCCSQFLNEFMPVSIKMAKTQSLSLNPTKISGTCGRLMCCLKYEQDAYEDAVHRCPKNDSFVECPDGVGDIISVNLLREQVRVKIDDSTDPAKTYRVDEVRVIRSGKGKRPEDYVAPPQSELEKLRYNPPEEERTRQLTSSDRLAAALESILSRNAAPVEEPPVAEEEPQPALRPRRRRGSRSGEKKQAEKPVAPTSVEHAEVAVQATGEKKSSPGKAQKKSTPAREEKKAPPKGDKKTPAAKPEKKHPPKGEKKQAQPTAKAKPAAPAPAGETPAADGGEKKAHHHRRHYYHRRPRSGGQGSPKSE